MKIQLSIILVILLSFCSCKSSILEDPSTSIRFSLHQESYVTLTIDNGYDTEVARLLDRKKLPAGTHSVLFNASNLAEGVYFYTIEIRDLNDNITIKKTTTMLLVK